MAEKNSDAAKVFRRGIDEAKLPAEKPAFEFYLAGALEMDGHTADALAVVQKMLDEKKPKESRYFARRPWILFHAKRNEEAYKAYQELIGRFDADYSSEENRDAMRSAREALSALCVTLHKPAEAEELLRQSLDEFPDDTGANNDLGYLWADQWKHLKRALAMIQRAVAAEPDNSAYRDSLGWALFRLGRDEEALVELKKAAAGDHPDATVLEHLGDVYDHLDKPAEALKNWKRALEGYEKEKDDEHIKAVRPKIDSQQATSDVDALDLKPPRLRLSKLPDIGDVLRGLPKSRVSELVFSAQFIPAYEANLSGVTYTIAVSKDTGKVLFVSVKGNGFRTPEGFSVENTVGDVSEKYPYDELEELGWGNYIRLPSGWNAYLGLQGKFNSKSRIMCFFKRSDSWK